MWLTQWQEHQEGELCGCSCLWQECLVNCEIAKIVNSLQNLSLILTKHKFAGRRWRISDFNLPRPLLLHFKRVYLKVPEEFTSANSANLHVNRRNGRVSYFVNSPSLTKALGRADYVDGTDASPHGKYADSDFTVAGTFYYKFRTITVADGTERTLFEPFPNEPVNFYGGN